MSEIIPALLPKNSRELKKSLSELPPEARLVHLDILEKDVWTPIDRDFEVHLMVKEPEKIIDKWIERGAKRVIIHSLRGSTSKWWKQVEFGLGVELGVALEEIYAHVSEFDFVQLMSIAKIGAQGYPFDERIFDRIKEVRAKFPQVPLSVDGGINTENYRKLQDAGADRLIVGSGFKELWKSLTKN